jgi:hypothetical protein
MAPPKKFGPGSKLEDLMEECKKQTREAKAAKAKAAVNQVALSMRFQMLMQVGRTQEASALIDIMKDAYEAEKRPPRVEIPEDHKLPSVLLAQKTVGPSPLTVEGLANPKNQFKSLDGEDSDAVDMMTKKPAAKAQDSSSSDGDSLSVPPSLCANQVHKTRAAVRNLGMTDLVDSSFSTEKEDSDSNGEVPV